MQKSVLLFLILISLTSRQILTAQDSCIVVISAISGEYRGGCKKGLANGYGEAMGEDYYIGNFKNGLPHGKGIYEWLTGETYDGEWKKGMRHGYGKFSFLSDGRDSILIGKWDKDQYIGDYMERPYIIEYRNNIGRVSFIRVSKEGSYVRVKFMRNGSESSSVGNLLLQGSSGMENTSNLFTGFEGVDFPFNGKIAFSAPNAFYSTTLKCELRYHILEAGSWVIQISY